MIAQSFLVAGLLLLARSGATADQQPQGVVEAPGAIQPVQVVGGQPHGPVIVEHGVVNGVVNGEPAVVPAPGEQVVHHVHHQPAQYYSPSGIIQVIGQSQSAPASQGPAQVQAQPQQYQPGIIVEPSSASVAQYANGAVIGTAAKPAQAIIKPYSGAGAGPEQYGQPESASIPANYKPWGSWGLYIGGNPADGYYSSYYKALSNSVDKQQVAPSESGASSSSGSSSSSSSPIVKPAGGPQAFVSQASGFSGAGAQAPMLKQGSFPYTYQDQGYPYDSYYTPADLNSGSRVSVAPQGYAQGQFGPSVYSYGPAPAAIEAGGSQAGPNVLSYAAESYAAGTKRVGAQAPPPPSSSTKSRDAQAPAKGYHYSYGAPPGVYAYSAGAPAGQVVAYPVPVGSQIVGSQPDAEGAFQPFGVHGFTRYAIKPTVVAGPGVASAPGAAEQYGHGAASPQAQGVHSAPVSQFPVYKQAIGYQQPLSFYGYPLSQLHYSQGSISPMFGSQGAIESSPSSSSPSSSSSSSSSSPVSPIGSQIISGIQQPQMGGNQAMFGYPVGVQPIVEAASSDKSEVKVEQPAAAKPTAVKPSQQK